MNEDRKKTIKVLLVDDHSIVREGVRSYLATQPHIEVVGEAADGREALRQAQALAPDDPDVKSALRAARWRLRFRMAWPIALPPVILLVGLLAYVRVSKRRHHGVRSGGGEGDGGSGIRA